MLNEKTEIMERSEIIKTVMFFLGTQLDPKDKKAVIDSVASGAKISKADAGRMLAPLTISELAGVGLIAGMTKKELIDAIAESAKLTKADAGRTVNPDPYIMQECWPCRIIKAFIVKLKTVFGGKGQINM